MKLVKQRYIDRDTNIIQMCRQVLLYGGVRHTTWQLSKMVSVHVEPFSLLAVHDILKSYGIDSIVVRLGDYPYMDFETPFVCALQRERWSHPALTVVYEVVKDAIGFWDPEYKRRTSISIADFAKIDKEVILLLDSSTKRDEFNYEGNEKEKIGKFYSRNLSFGIFGLLMMLTLVTTLLAPLAMTWLAVVFLISSSTGVLLSSLLLWHKVDAFHPFLKEVCGGFGNKADPMKCSDVLLHIITANLR